MNKNSPRFVYWNLTPPILDTWLHPRLPPMLLYKVSKLLEI